MARDTRLAGTLAIVTAYHEYPHVEQLVHASHNGSVPSQYLPFAPCGRDRFTTLALTLAVPICEHRTASRNERRGNLVTLRCRADLRCRHELVQSWRRPRIREYSPFHTPCVESPATACRMLPPMTPITSRSPLVAKRHHPRRRHDSRVGTDVLVPEHTTAVRCSGHDSDLLPSDVSTTPRATAIWRQSNARSPGGRPCARYTVAMRLPSRARCGSVGLAV